MHPNWHLTRLFRNEAQLAVLVELLSTQQHSPRILVHACTDGAEAVSLLATILRNSCHGEAMIVARDLGPDYIRQAAQYHYSKHYVQDGVDMRQYRRFIKRHILGGYSLAREYRRMITYEVKDVLEDDTVENFDMVLAQNMLVGFTEPAIMTALRNLDRKVRPGGHMVVGGGPLDIIWQAKQELGYAPVLTDVERIHESWLVQRRFHDKGSSVFWALEPYDARHPMGPERYCTIFRKNGI